MRECTIADDASIATLTWCANSAIGGKDDDESSGEGRLTDRLLCSCLQREGREEVVEVVDVSHRGIMIDEVVNGETQRANLNLVHVHGIKDRGF